MVRKHKMQKMSASAKELKLDTNNVGLSTPKEDQADNSPPTQILAFPVSQTLLDLLFIIYLEIFYVLYRLNIIY